MSWADRSLSLHARLTLLMSALIGAIGILAGLYLPYRLQTEAIKSAHARGEALAEVTAYGVRSALSSNDPAGASEAIGGACRAQNVISVTVLDGHDNLFARCLRRTNDGGPVQTIEVPVEREGQEHLGRLLLILSLSDVRQRITTDQRRVVLTTVIAVVISVLAVLAISSLATASLRRISLTADAIRHGNTSLRVQIRSRDEVGHLAEAFNHMLDSLEGARVDLAQLNRTLELKVAQRTRELTEILDSAYDGIFAVDAEGRCMLANPAAAEILRAPAADFIGKDLHAMLHGGCKADCELAAALNQESRTWTRARFSLPGTHEPLSVEVSCVPIEDDEGHHTGSVITFRDMSERERLQEQLEHANRLNSLGQLAATLAHEFNNVLMGIGPFVEIIRRSPGDFAAVFRACGIIEQSVARGKGVTQEVLRYTRPAAPSIADFDAARWLGSWIAAARVTLPKNVQIETRIPPDVVLAAADQSQLEQVMVNLVSNARDAMGQQGGAIRISLQPVQRDTRAWVEIAVSDSGPGMDEDTAGRVFEPFYTTKKIGGTGLGLTVVEQIVSRNGGRIALNTALGAGATFRVMIPAVAGAAVASSGIAAARSERGRLLPMTVLVVEDDEAIAAGLSELLRQEGMVVVVASSGRQALEILKLSATEAVLLDIGLPDMDGIDVYRKFAEEMPSLPVIFSTGHADARRLGDILKRGNVDFLLKPYDMEILLSKLSALTAAQHATPGGIPADRWESAKLM